MSHNPALNLETARLHLQLAIHYQKYYPELGSVIEEHARIAGEQSFCCDKSLDQLRKWWWPFVDERVMRIIEDEWSRSESIMRVND